MRFVKLAVVFSWVVGCTPAAMTVGAEHPANPDAPAGRVAGPPPALRPGAADPVPVPPPPPVEVKPPEPTKPADRPKPAEPEPAKKPPVKKPAPKPAPKPEPPPTHDHHGHH